MKSYTTLRNLYGSLTNNTSSGNLTLGDQMINDSIRTILNINKGQWWFLDTVETDVTVASQSWVKVPANIRKLITLTVSVGSVVYTPTPVFDDDTWNQILTARLAESDIPLFYRRIGTKIHFQPVPASNGNTVTMNGRINVADLNTADYTTGTIVSVAQDGVAVVGFGTTWTASMAGRYLRITSSDTANKGDGLWYKIASVQSATTLTLDAPYEGAAIAAGAAVYAIGQMSVIPEAYDVAPVYRAVALYWMQKDQAKSTRYWKMYDGGQEAGLSRDVGGLLGQMIENETGTVEAGYMSPIGNPRIDPNTPQQTLATGF